MIASQKLNLAGRYKFSLYDRSGNLKSSDCSDNFITASGLSYPKDVAFGDCFRYVSLGSGNIANLISTTGLQTKIPQFSYIGGDETQYDLNSCGYRENADGVTLSRGWRIPVGDDFFDGPYTFSEFMVSPGQPLSGGNCNEDIDITSNYPNICNYTKAFSRIVKEINVDFNEYLIITYELSIIVNTGINFLLITPQTAGAFNNTNNNWVGIHKGYYGLVHHGVNLIKNPDTTKPTNIPQNFNSPNDGESFIGPLGNPMEPYVKGRYSLYLSTDKTQFLVSEISGGAMDTGLYRPYTSIGKPQPSGNLYYHSQPAFETNMGANIPYWLVNIREQDGPYYPTQADFRLIGTPSDAGYDLETILADGISVTYNSFTNTDRTRSKKLSCQLRNTSVPLSMLNQPIRSMVLGFKGTDTSQIYPIIDLIFADKIYGVQNPLSTGDFTFTVPNNYSELDGQNDLTFEFNISWSSPCPAGMAGCT